MARTMEALVQEVRKALEAHNTSLSEGTSKIDFDKFWTGLQSAGGTTVDSLGQVSWEDLQELGLPKLLAKSVAQIFHSSEASEVKPKESGPKRVKRKDAEVSTCAQLLAVYDPKNPFCAAADEMRKRSKGQPFILFNDKGELVPDVSATLLQELVEGERPRSTYAHGDKVYDLYRVGESPGDIKDEHPLFPGDALRKDGTDSIGIKWGAIPIEIRQRLRLSVQSAELRVARDDNDKLFMIFELASKPDAIVSLNMRYPLAAADFTRKEGLGQLPTLKIRPKHAGNSCTGGGGQHPFFAASAHKVY